MNDISIIGWARPYGKNSAPRGSAEPWGHQKASTPTLTPSPRLHSVMMPRMLQG